MKKDTSKYSVKQVSKALVEEITKAVQSVESYGSVEIYVQDGIVNQITIRKIKKTNYQDKNTGKKIQNVR